MTNTMLKTLKETLERLEAERDQLAQEADGFRQVIAYYEKHGSELEARTPPPAKEIRNMAVQILQEEGKPLHYKEIYERLLKQGITVGGKKPANNMGAQMSQDQRFKSLSQGIWGLASWQKLPRRETPDNGTHPTEEVVPTIGMVRPGTAVILGNGREQT